MIELLIEVTETDIRIGAQGDAHYCAVHHAVRRKTHNQLVCVDGSELQFVYRGQRYRCLLTQKIQNFIDRFDEHVEVQPLSFKILLNGTKAKVVDVEVTKRERPTEAAEWQPRKRAAAGGSLQPVPVLRDETVCV